jgi:predicted MPP superfamily phosphohydrolase
MGKATSKAVSKTKRKLIPKDSSNYVGLLVIGDPHIEGRQPGFRKDDFPTVVLEKVRWCLKYAKENSLLPVFLGDMFDKPRDNPTWVIGQLIEMLSEVSAIGIYGNHDCAETTLNENDSLSILIKSGTLRMVDQDDPWIGKMNGRNVYVGGSSYRQPIPDKFELKSAKQTNFFDGKPYCVWITHHDISIAGYDNGRFRPFEIEGVDLLINGHIHRRLKDVVKGQTTWKTPGNISRRSRSDANKKHIPQALRIDVFGDLEKISDVVIPHQPFHEVFHEEIVELAAETSSSEFVSGLAELIARRTESGAGLHQFLNENIEQFEPEVACEILALAEEVTQTAATNEETANA